MNITHLRGNLTRDIEIRYASTGTAIAKTAIATSKKFTSNGERKEEIMFIDITFFGKSAETANQYLNKGSNIIVTGRLIFQSWVDRNGTKRTKHELIVETMEMVDTRTKAPSDLQNTQGMPQSNGVQNTQPSLDMQDESMLF